jgi:hypothetical protein
MSATTWNVENDGCKYVIHPLTLSGGCANSALSWFAYKTYLTNRVREVLVDHLVVREHGIVFCVPPNHHVTTSSRAYYFTHQNDVQAFYREMEASPVEIKKYQ